MGKHKTYRGIEINHYREMREGMSKEAFAKWVRTVTGKPRGRGKDPMVVAIEESIKQRDAKPQVDWEALAKKLQKALTAQINECKYLERIIESHQERIIQMENLTWFQRLFNLKG